MNPNRKRFTIFFLIFLLVALATFITIATLNLNKQTEINVSGSYCSRSSSGNPTLCSNADCSATSESSCKANSCCTWILVDTTQNTCYSCNNGSCSQSTVTGPCDRAGKLQGSCSPNKCVIPGNSSLCHTCNGSSCSQQTVTTSCASAGLQQGACVTGSCAVTPTPTPPSGNVGECGGCSQGGAITCSSGTCCSCGKCGGVSKTCNAICNQNACGGGTPAPVPAPNPPPQGSSTFGSTSTTTGGSTTTSTSGTSAESSSTTTTTGSTTNLQQAGSTSGTNLPATGVTDSSAMLIFGIFIILIGVSLVRVRKL